MTTYSKVILFVDDEPIVLTSLKQQLKREFPGDYVLGFAESAPEALELLTEYSDGNAMILIVVSDWLMPGIKGDEFLIDVHQRYPGTITVMLTGQADPAAVQRAVDEARLFKCLAKPWRKEELVKTIKDGITLASARARA